MVDVQLRGCADASGGYSVWWGVLVVVVDTMVDQDVLAMAVVDVNLRTLQLVKEVLPLVADHGIHIEILGIARLTVL